MLCNRVTVSEARCSLLQSHRKPAFQNVGEKLLPIIDVPPDRYNKYIVDLLESGKVAVLISSDSYHELAEFSCVMLYSNK